jgi:phosphate transport system permease protein
MPQTANNTSGSAGETVKSRPSGRSRFLSRYLADNSARVAVILCASASFIILLAIIFFILKEGLPAFVKVGFFNFLFGTEWRPTRDSFGILPMIIGSLR